MQFRVLGPVEAAAGGRQASVGSHSQRVILAVLLAARDGSASADRLVEAVWGSGPPVSARKTLHSHVSRLRRALADVAPDGADALVTRPDGYRLDRERHDVDADRFEALVSEARAGLDRDPEQAVRRLDEALALWRGEAFGELAAHEPVRPEAVRLDGLRAAAAADRIDALLALGRHHAVVGELEAAVAADPLAERPHAQLMLALYRSGRQADALAVHRRLRQRLADEVGVDPSPESQALHDQILRQDAALAPPRPAAPAEAGGGSPGGGPVATSGGSLAATPSDRAGAAAPAEAGGGSPGPPPRHAGTAGLVGRDKDVAAVATLVASSPLVTLTGPGGVGKSRLADAVAAEAAERFDDGVVVCPLAGVPGPDSVAEALVAATGGQHKGDRSSEEALLAALGTRRLLLVIDNCEHVLEAAAALVDRIRGRCPRVAVLATSREHLHLPGERVWEVTPLPVPRAGASAAEVAETPAGALFCSRAQAAEPSFALSAANAEAVAELCRRLDGIPLAIELAASRVRALATDDLAARIGNRFDLLTGGPHREGGRHRTLQAVVAWSYDLLTVAEARLFERLSVFAGPFPLAAAEQVCAGEPLDERQVAGLLAELVDKSLVAVDRDGGRVRYRLLDTLRAFGAQRLAERGEETRARRVHADYHVRLAEDLGARVRRADERDAIAGIDAAVDDLRVAHDWLVGSEESDAALRLSAALHDDLTFRPRAEVFDWAEAALRLPGAEASAAYPASMVTAARGAMDRGELDRARQLAEAALDRSAPDTLAALWARYLLTTVALYEGRLEAVIELAEQRVRLADELASDYHRALAEVSRALGHRYQGDDEAAGRAAARAREAAERSGNHTARAWTRYASGEALLDTGPAEAAALLEQAIDAARLADRHFIEGVALVSLASLRGRTGDTARAVPLFREAVALWRRLGNYTNQLTTLRNLVELLARVGADESAALLHGAVTAGSAPTFGAEAQRLDAAWAQVEQRLGPRAAGEAAARGRGLAPAQTGDAALAELDMLLGIDEPAQRAHSR